MRGPIYIRGVGGEGAVLGMDILSILSSLKKKINILSEARNGNDMVVCAYLSESLSEKWS